MTTIPLEEDGDFSPIAPGYYACRDWYQWRVLEWDGKQWWFPGRAAKWGGNKGTVEAWAGPLPIRVKDYTKPPLANPAKQEQEFDL